MQVNVLSSAEFAAKIRTPSSSSDRLKLFAVMLGGNAVKSNIELHDVVFVIGKCIADCILQLQCKWFGISKGLHIDVFAELTCVDGYDIEVSKVRQDGPKLYCVNYGGYDSKLFGELHDIGFFGATNAYEAKTKAKTLCCGAQKVHCDNVIDISQNNMLVDQLIEIGEINGYYVNLKPNGNNVPIVAYAGYCSIEPKTNPALPKKQAVTNYYVKELLLITIGFALGAMLF